MLSNLGEYFFVTVLSTVMAGLAAIAGFVGVIFLCGLLPGEFSEWMLILAPAAAFVIFVATFWVCYGKLLHNANSEHP